MDSRESWKNVSIQGELQKGSEKHFEQLKYLKFPSTNSAKNAGRRLSDINPQKVNNSAENERNLSKNFNSLKNFFVREDSLNIAVKAKQRMVVHEPKKYYQVEEFKRRIEPADINACGNDNSNASESVSGMLSRSS